jgi:hypothetical protein
VTAHTQGIVTAAITVGGPLAVLAVAWLLSRRTPASEPEAVGLVPTGWRYCPGDLQQRAAVLHPDGSATCADCGAHISPAGA